MRKAFLICSFLFLYALGLSAQQKLTGVYYRQTRTFYPKDTGVLVKSFGNGSLAPFMIKGKNPFIEEENRVGFIDTAGNIIINPDYANCSYFEGDYALVRQCVANQRKYGVIDRAGKVVIPGEYDLLLKCFNGMFMIEQQGKIGFITASGGIIVPPEKYTQFARPLFPGIWEYDDVGHMDFRWDILQFDPSVPFGKYIGLKNGKKWAVIDSTGREIIPPKFDAIGIFNKTAAPVKMDNKYGVTDTAGNLIIPALYDEIELTGKDFVYATTGGKMGVLSLVNKTIIPLRYLSINQFGTGFTAYDIENKAFLYDTGGRLISGPADYPVINFPLWGRKETGFFVYNNADKKFHVYQDILDRQPDGNYRRQLFYMRDKKWGVMDTAGREITAPLFDEIDYEKLNFIDDDQHKLIAAKQNGKWGIVNKKGKTLLPFSYDEFVADKGKLFVRIGNKCGMFSDQLIKLTPVKYDSILTTHAEDQTSNYRDSTFFISAKVNKKWGLLSSTGKELTPFKYDSYLRFSHRLAFVTNAGKYGVVNSTGKQIAACIYDNITFIKDNRGVYYYENNGQLLVKKNGLYGVIGSNGNQLVPAIYDDVAGLHYPWGGKYLVTLKGREGIFDGASQKMTVPCYYSDLNFFTNYRTDKTGYYTYIIAKKDGFYGLLDTAGKICLPIKYDRIYIDPQNHCYVYLNDDQQVFDDNLKLIVPSK